MSCTLCWKPVSKTCKSLDDALKFALRKRYGPTIHTTLDSSDFEYLEGLRDAGVKDADTILDAIEKYGQISLFEEC